MRLTPFPRTVSWAGRIVGRYAASDVNNRELLVIESLADRLQLIEPLFAQGMASLLTVRSICETFQA
jgi:hypothetical protein